MADQWDCPNDGYNPQMFPKGPLACPPSASHPKDRENYDHGFLKREP